MLNSLVLRLRPPVMAVRTSLIARLSVHIFVAVITLALPTLPSSRIPRCLLRLALTSASALRVQGWFTMFPSMLGFMLLPGTVHLVHAPILATNDANQPPSGRVSRINAQERHFLQTPLLNVSTDDH